MKKPGAMKRVCKAMLDIGIEDAESIEGKRFCARHCPYVKCIVEEGTPNIRELRVSVPTKDNQQLTQLEHPVFIKYKRHYLSRATGYSKGYLSRVATGKLPITRSFIERCCFRLGEPEEKLFLPREVTNEIQS